MAHTARQTHENNVVALIREQYKGAAENPVISLKKPFMLTVDIDTPIPLKVDTVTLTKDDDIKLLSSQEKEPIPTPLWILDDEDAEVILKAIEDAIEYPAGK